MPDTTTETPKTKKRRLVRRSRQTPGWEERMEAREKARIEREAKIDRILDLAEKALIALSTPCPPPFGKFEPLGIVAKFPEVPEPLTD